MNYNDSAHQQEGSVTTVVPGGEAAGIENPLRSPSIAEASAPPPVYDAAVVVAPTITAVAAAPAAAAEDQGTRPAQPGDLVIPALAIEAQPDSKVTPHDDVSTEPPSANQLDESGGVATPGTMDVLCGRGAFVNARLGNKKFRALCFSRKPEVGHRDAGVFACSSDCMQSSSKSYTLSLYQFDVGNLAAKRRISSEIVHVAMTDWGSRFLRRSKDKGPWTEMTAEQAMLKASQVMRDYKRPDRVAQRESIASASGKKKKKHLDSATPMEDVVVPDGPLQPIVENPFGVHDHDVLCGRGAFVNGHIGNQRLRDLAIERKAQFDRGSYTEKRGLATEVVTIIRSLNPPGRFLQRASAPSDPPAEGATSITKGPQQDGSTWEELSDEKAIHKVGSPSSQLHFVPNFPFAHRSFRHARLCATLIDQTANTEKSARN